MGGVRGEADGQERRIRVSAADRIVCELKLPALPISKTSQRETALGAACEQNTEKVAKTRKGISVP